MDIEHRPILGGMALERRRRAPRGLRLILAAVLVALFAEIIYILIASPRLAVREVVIRGEPTLAAEVAKNLELRPNTSYLMAPLTEIRKQVEGISAVREARVGRGLPRRLIVTVERREAVAVVRKEEKAILIDINGISFILPGESGWGLPELVGPALMEGEMTSEAAREEMEVLLKVLRALGPDPLIRPTRLVANRTGEVEVICEGGAVASLGRPEQLASKVKLLSAVIEKLGREQIARLDLSDPATAYWQPREDGEGRR